MNSKLSFATNRVLASVVLFALIALCTSVKFIQTASARTTTPALMLNTGAWATKVSMPTVRPGPMSGVINGMLYVAGGYSVSGANVITELSLLEVYDPAANSWTTKAAMPTARHGGASAVINGKLYVAGGCLQAGSQFTNALEVYDPATNTWTTKAPMPTARCVAEAAAIDGKLYVVGGAIIANNTFPRINVLEVYDPANDTWTTKAPMPTSRAFIAAEGISGRLYVVGGALNGDVITAALEVYDPATNSWSTKVPMPTPRYGLTSGFIGGRLYAVGGVPGNTGPSETATNESYDPVTNTWRTEDPMPTARWESATGVINDTLHVVGGATGRGFGVPLAVNEAFSPRLLRVLSNSAAPGSNVPLPVELVSTGDENALGFSITFDPSVLSNPQVGLGADAATATLNLNTSQTAQGRLGIAVALPATQKFTAGTRQLVNVTFTIAANAQMMTTLIGFGDQPIAREVVNDTANVLPASYSPGSVMVTPGYEADVSPRPNGNNNGTVTIVDWVQVGRFAAGLDTAATGNEFQRADCAPKATLGDGKIGITDWVQAGRYAAGVDPVAAAGGPTTPISGFLAGDDVRFSRTLSDATPSAGAATTSSARFVRALATNIEPERSGTIAIELDATGDENALGFSLNFDAAQLQFISAVLGSGASGASLNVNTAQAVNGRVGMALALPTNQTFAAGRRQLIVVTLVAKANANALETAVTLGDLPVGREIVDAVANALTATWSAVVVTLARPVTSVSAASFNSDVLAGEAIVAAFGSNLASTTQIATTVPLPTQLAGTSVKVKDSAGVERLAPLFFVAPTQVNYLVPAGTAAGDAIVTITSGDGTVSVGKVRITNVSPGLFSANASGQGVVAGVVLRVKGDGSQVYEAVSRYDTLQQRFVAAPIDLGPESDQLFLILYGTGWRYRSSIAAVTAKIGSVNAEILYAGLQGDYVGLDQLNVRLPRSLAGRGTVDIALRIDGIAANIVTVSVK